MRTDTLVELLARGADPVPPHAVMRRLLVGVGIGTAGAVLLLIGVFGLNPALADFVMLPDFWMKMGYTLALSIGAISISQRLARPGVAVGGGGWLVAVPVLAMWTLALIVLANADAPARADLVFGSTWNACPFNIALLSLPVFVATVWALRGLGPTEPRFAGAAAGLCSGALGAWVYGLHCPEFAPPFLAVWYVIGMLIPSAIGFVLGPRLLRW